MNCPKCGNIVPEESKFCSKCGAVIDKTVGNSEKTELLIDNEKTELLKNSCPNVSNDSEKTELLDDDKTEFLNSDNPNIISSDKTEGLFKNNNSDEKTELLNNEKTELLSSEKTELLGNNSAPSQSQTPDFPSSAFSTYQILGRIGQGSGGVVYKALHTRLQKEVVIKEITSPGTALNRNETDLLKGIKHSYLPQVLDFIEENGKAYTVMDFISGSDIDRQVKNGRKFRSKEIIKVGRELCEAVSYLHGLNPPVIHSDIKPANVMLNDNGDICLIDFNVSLVFDKNASVIGGTKGYAAPEQLGISPDDIQNGVTPLQIGKIKPTVSERSDVYSIGALLYFMITGEVPSADYKVKPVYEYNARVPEGLLHIVNTAMSLNPAKRYKTAKEMLSAINNIGKLDKRYKALKAQRTVATVLAVILMAGSVTTCLEGKRVLAVEHEEKYQSYIQEIKDNIASENFDKAEEIIKTASEFEPLRIEPYYNQTLIYYLQKDYESCGSYPDKVLTAEITENELNDRENFAQMYEMSAESRFELEDYDNAAFMYEKALSFSDKMVDCYRDLTISYARLGKIDKAESSLQTAKDKGISSDKLELMQGEISAAKGDTEAAFNSFVKTLELTDDDYIRFRAILVCDKTMLKEKSKENAQKMVALLEEQQSKVSTEYEGIVKEMLANEYAEAEDYQNAAKTYGELLDKGILNYTLQKNYFSILYAKLNDYQKCLELLDNMKSQNTEDYWVEMNYAYIRISIENEKEQPQRDYAAAYANYQNAEKLYSTFAENGKSDANMDNLRALIDELKSYGWIKEN